jgi:hypothetical protein
LDNDLVHTAGFNEEDIGVLETEVIVMGEFMFWHCYLTGLPEPYVPVVYSDPAVNGLACLSDVCGQLGLQFLGMLHGIGW